MTKLYTAPKPKFERGEIVYSKEHKKTRIIKLRKFDFDTKSWLYGLQFFTIYIKESELEKV